MSSRQSSGNHLTLDRLVQSKGMPPHLPDQTHHAINTASILSRAAARLGVEFEIDVRDRMPLPSGQIRGAWLGRHGRVVITGSPDDAVADFVPRPLVSQSTRIDGDLDVTIRWRLPTDNSQDHPGIVAEESLKKIAHSRYMFQELAHLHIVEYKPWTILFDGPSPSDTANLCQSTTHGLVRALEDVGEPNNQFSIVKSDGLALPKDCEPLFEIGNQTVIGSIDWDNHSEWQWQQGLDWCSESPTVARSV